MSQASHLELQVLSSERKSRPSSVSPSVAKLFNFKAGKKKNLSDLQNSFEPIDNNEIPSAESHTNQGFQSDGVVQPQLNQVRTNHAPHTRVPNLNLDALKNQ